MRVTTFSKFHEHSSPIFKHLNIVIKLPDLVFLYIAVFMYKFHNRRLPSVFDTFFTQVNNKQLLDEVFVISGIIKVEVSVILIIPDITKTESNNCFIIHCFEENSDKRIIAAITVYFQTLKNVQLSDKQIFTVFIKQSSAEKLNQFLKKVSLNLYLQVISQFLAGSMKRIEKPFFLRCPWTWHCCPWTWHCSWKSCIARATYRLFTNL